MRSLLVLLLALVLFGCGPKAGVATPSLSPTETAPPPPVAQAAPHSDVGFASERKFQEHFRKHGREFGKITAEEYLRMAQDLRDKPAGGDVLEAVRPDGVRTRYDRSTGAFLACNRDGTIRTFFKPNAGERYFERQARSPH